MIGDVAQAQRSTIMDGLDVSVYGLRLSNTIRYQNRGTGLAQTRVDSPGSLINDAYAYFGQDANTICFLAMSDHVGRTITVMHGTTVVPSGYTNGLFLNSAPAGANWVNHNGIHDIVINICDII